MPYRLEDRGLTLRLFVSESDALACPGANNPTRYATGWLAQDAESRWMDADGVLPEGWQPHSVILELSNAPPGAAEAVLGNVKCKFKLEVKL